MKRAEVDVSSNLQQDFKAYEMIDSKVLGQHGGELLLESMYSAFDPQVLGMICLKSKVLVLRSLLALAIILGSFRF